jgi:hypothetical protein
VLLSSKSIVSFGIFLSLDLYFDTRAFGTDYYGSADFNEQLEVKPWASTHWNS